jgi:crotonobetainyl-CoA:carnitine CoA-transferase CaiB-like acyl-CoA transferase
MVLGDLGAEVVKVEPPEGDETRRWGPPFAGGESAYYLCINRNKRGMVVNLKTEQGRAILVDLAKQCDVLVENFRPGTLARYSLDYESVQALNPRLVYCSITGFGQNGPLRDHPGYDFMIQAMSGLMSITGDPDGEPMKVGVAVADLFAGQNAVIAILAALQARERTGSGQHLDISLFDSQLGSLANVASNYLISGSVPKRYGNAHANIVPYQSFRASDGHFVLTVGNDSQFIRLCELVNRLDLSVDPRFSTNDARVNHREELTPILQSIFGTKPVAHWLSMLESIKIPCSTINTIDQVFSLELVSARGMLVQMEHSMIGDLPLVGSPLKLSDTPVAYRLPPPLKGEHTKEILTELLGYSEIQVDEFRSLGII